MRKTTFLLLIIYTLISTEIMCQNINLKINGNSELETKIIDSLGYLKTHDDFFSIKTEINAFQNSLFNLGYIENKALQLEKLNDSTFHFQIFLKKKFKSIYVYYNKSNIDQSVLDLVSEDIYDDYFILDFSETENALQIINSEISKKGLPFSKLKLTNIKTKDSTNLEATLTINSLGKRTIDNILVKGYDNFPGSYLTLLKD